MELLQLLLKEQAQEARTTRKMLERVPNDKSCTSIYLLRSL